MKKISTLLMLFCAFVGSAWAQTVVTTVEPGKKYVLQCKATDHQGYIADDGTVVKGKENNPSLFAFETTDVEGAYYLKSLESNKYLNTTDNKQIVASETPSTKWVLKTYEHTANAVSLNPVGVNNFLNNVQSHNDGTTSDLWLNPNHGAAGPGSGNACSLWTLLEWNLELPELTTDESSPVYYTIKNMRGSVYAAYFGAAHNIRLSANIGDESLFYFTAGTAGTYVIHNKVTGKKLAAVNSWNDEGINWFIKIAGVNQHYGYAIATDATLGTAWNNEAGANKSVATWSGNDIGSTWTFEKYEGTVPGIQLSTDETKVLYNIQNARTGRYANFVKHYSSFTQEGTPALGSYWYFVQDETAQESAPEGVVACRVFNALHTTGVEDHETGHMGTDQWPAKVYYIKKHENDYYGYVIYDPAKAEDTQGWNAYGSTRVCQYYYNDAGSIWNLIPTTKTIDQLKTEVTTQSNNWKNLISAYAEADYYSYPAEAVATAKTAIEGADVTGDLPKMYLGYLVQKEAFETLKATEKTAGPVAGQYIQLKNKQYGTYLKPNDNGTLGGVANGNDSGTLWVVEAGTDGNVKLKHAATEKYLGEIRQSANVNMVEDANAKQFAFTNQVDCYAVFKETSGGDYAYGHIAGHNILVGWSRDANATQWIVSEVTLEESLADLQDIYDVVDNAFGTEPGQYKEMVPSPTDELYMAWYLADNALSSEGNKDVYTIFDIAYALKTEWNTQLANPDSREINLPVQGKFYRLKNVASGRYMNVKNASSVVVTDAGENLPATIFYLGEDNTLLSYSLGQYLDCQNKKLAAVGTSFSGEFAAASSGAKPNTIMYKNNDYWTFGNRDNDVSIDRGSTKPDADDLGYDWELEEVTWLPVPMNTTAGYATLYAPVALNNGSRVEAYVGKAEGEWFKMTRVDEEDGVIPANTPVVLKYVEGAQVENNCVYLQVSDSEKAAVVGEENELEGTFADTYITSPAYALGFIDSEVGFYTAKMTDSQWLNNGFKAYLPKNGVAPTLRFNFGGTTAIESVLNNGVDANAPIYDLSGRRVNNAVKGGIYIQNGKKFIVK